MKEPAFGGEVQFAGYSDSSRSGPRVTFRLADREDLEKFVGMEGKRFMLALVQIADDETPAENRQETGKKPAEKLGPLAMLAVRWCKDEDFQAWLNVKSESEAKARILSACGVTSRRELDTDKYAPTRFNVLVRKPYAEHLAEIGVTA